MNNKNKEISKKILSFLKSNKVIERRKVDVLIAMPLEHLAAKMQMSAPALRYKLKHHSWRIKEVQGISEILGISLGELLGENGENIVVAQPQEQGEK